MQGKKLSLWSHTYAWIGCPKHDNLQPWSGPRNNLKYDTMNTERTCVGSTMWWGGRRGPGPRLGMQVGEVGHMAMQVWGRCLVIRPSWELGAGHAGDSVCSVLHQGASLPWCRAWAFQHWSLKHCWTFMAGTTNRGSFPSLLNFLHNRAIFWLYLQILDTTKFCGVLRLGVGFIMLALMRLWRLLPHPSRFTFS